ncbi:MAG: biotin/lipoyl-binding protein [Bacteroidales bacterium]|jgi:biotin carboxyl carrier protein|nr:biotin/lipoyl-binding protein [Bacteroidales bacterium]MBQ2148442.1 biotin/lipoyl-binding protein [Bacteroidales bacterium]MBQ5435672.1 biotin/lipoyl-binding protein [Bacteroidales bacterium]MBQ5438791.1 biotin/lipoyl-binding protein [Bacteroidales bacterium]MBQ5529817.1 biotin/lipoyl-binding protein [Bacteroidales bacterium]
MKEYKIKINGNNYNVTIDEVEDNMAKVEVNGTPYNVEFEKPISKPKTISVVNKPAAAPSAGPAPANKPAAAPAAAGGATVNSPLPGVVLEIKVKDGDKVTKGQVIMVLEAMKMENAIEAPCEGTITVKAQKGDSVLEGATLAVIA